MSDLRARHLPGATASLLLARLTFKRLLHSRSALVTMTFALLPIAYAFAAAEKTDASALELWRTAFEVSLLLLAITWRPPSPKRSRARPTPISGRGRFRAGRSSSASW